MQHKVNRQMHRTSRTRNGMNRRSNWTKVQLKHRIATYNHN